MFKSFHPVENPEVGWNMGSVESVVKTLVAQSLHGWATGGIVGSVGLATLEYAVRPHPLHTLPYAALDGFMWGSQVGAAGAVSGTAIEWVANATR